MPTQQDNAAADPSAQAAPPARLTDIIDQVIGLGGDETVSLRSVLDAVGTAGFAPVLLTLALAVATPLSGIPLFSAFTGVLIFLVSVQMLIRRSNLWLPSKLLDRTVKGSALAGAFRKIRPVAGWMDRRTATRFRILSHRPFILVPQILCVLSGLMMPFLEFIPFSSSIVGVGVAILALGMLMRDGVVLLIGLAPYFGLIALLNRFLQ